MSATDVVKVPKTCPDCKGTGVEECPFCGDDCVAPPQPCDSCGGDKVMWIDARGFWRRMDQGPY